MAAEVVPYFLPQFFDNNGKPLAGGKVYTYKAGTTTPIATYKDANFTPNENPIILDSAGRASIYVGIQPVKFVICDADDNVIETRDHVSGASSTAVGIQTVVPIETDGVKTEFDLGIDPELPQNCMVVLVTSGGDRITFLTSEYTVSGTKIIFNSPPPAGTGEVRIGATRAIASSGLSDGSVSTPKLQDGAVTNAKLADNSVGTSKIQDEAVTEPKIADAAIVTRHLSAGSVTNDKRAPLGQQISEVTTGLASGIFETDSPTPVDVTNLQVTLQTTGRPVWLGLISAIAGGDESPYPMFVPPGVEISSRFNEPFAEGHIHFVRNGSEIDRLAVGLSALPSASTTIANSVTTPVHTHNATTNVNLGPLTKQDPLSSFWTIDRPPAGTHTYKVQASVFVGIMNIILARLIAFEL